MLVGLDSSKTVKYAFDKKIFEVANASQSLGK